MIRTRLLFLALAGAAATAAGQKLPLAKPDLVFEEKDGLLTFEAEHFYEQKRDEVRKWYLTTRDLTPDVKPDGDPSHIGGASGGAYLEILPDTRRTHGDKLIKGENFSNEPGKMGVLSYKVHINTPGKYYIWGRANSTTSEDNGFHIGLDGEWPASGQRWQTVVKKKWNWESKQRTEKVHSGERYLLFLEIDKPGPHTISISMREDGIALDKLLFTTDREYVPRGLGPKPTVKSGTLPKAFPLVDDAEPVAKPAGQKKFPEHWGKPPEIQTADIVPLPGGYGNGSSTLKGWIEANLAADAKKKGASLRMPATAFPIAGSNYYLDKNKWLAIDPEKAKTAKATAPFPFPSGKYDLTLLAVGENDGSSTYTVAINDDKIGEHTCPLSEKMFAEGAKYHKTWKNLAISQGDVITVSSTIGSKDGAEFSRARLGGLRFAPADEATKKATAGIVANQPAKPATPAPAVRSRKPALHGPRGEEGDGSVAISGELKAWHKVTLDLSGPFAHELDRDPNPFTDYNFVVGFEHESGSPKYTVPGYFAADGRAGESSAQSGNVWRAHLSPDKPGKWTYTTSLITGPNAAIGAPANAKILEEYHKTGTFTVVPTDKSGRDFRAQGRLSYVGKNHLQFAGSKKYFLKAGADAPETFLGYADFDNTEARNPKKVPLKTWKAHEKDWKPGDPTWKGGKGKGMIGALNYLSGKGANVFSFLPYNAGGDGDNVWPFAAYGDKFQYDCSKLDQWGIVFEHATEKGLYLHFKLQETEMDDNNRGGHKGDRLGHVPAALDGGDLGPERKLYCRELVARYGHLLALNWNLGEENTQTTKQQMDMAGYLREVDPYEHNLVVHTFPNMQDKVYNALLGKKEFTGISLQNSNVKDCHHQVVKWTSKSREAKQPWVVAFDEPGDASLGMPPDPDYPGFPKNYKGPTIDDVRKYTLWGTILAGGGGVEYYFGYKLPQNDLVCEDWRSRDKSWDFCRIALEFFENEKIPFADMINHNELVGNTKNDNSRYCYAKPGEVYLVFLPEGGSAELDLKGAKGKFQLSWFNPRDGSMNSSDRAAFPGGQSVKLTAPDKKDWLAVIRR